MSTFHPLQSRRIAVQRVREVGVHAALRKDREERVIHVDGWHAGESIGCQVGREADVTEGWVIVADAGRVHAVYAESAREQHRRSDRPVVLRAPILGVGYVDNSVTLITADNRGSGIFIVVATVTAADLVVAS